MDGYLMTYEITYEPNPTMQDIQILGDGIMQNAREKRGHKDITFFGFFIRDEQGNIVAGCNGDNLYGCLYVSQLWVAEKLRGQDYGTKLMQAAEKLARDGGCVMMTVNTMDWEALGFYQKLGFKIEFERRGLAKDSIFYFLRKELID